jgi:hypothetical protein
MTEGTGRGTPALLVVGQVLQTAARAVASQEAARAYLKVRSGEHLAAIFLSGLFGCTPSGFDHDGGPDLVFDAYPGKSWFPYGNPAAFEIKSLPGAYRENLSLLMRNGASGGNAELPFQLRLWTADEVMRDARPTLVRAERSLVRKTPSRYSRNIFLITHPFDHFALDVARSRTVSHLMPDMAAYGALDSVWVFWPPGKLGVPATIFRSRRQVARRPFILSRAQSWRFPVEVRQMLAAEPANKLTRSAEAAPAS